jgi:replicative DNA helicase
VIAPPLPRDEEAEAAILGALCLDASLLPFVRTQLPAEAFDHAGHRRIYLHLCAMGDAGEPLEILSLRSRLERAGELEAVGGVMALSALLDATPTAANVSAHVRLVREAWKLRQLARRGEDLLTAIRTRAGTPDELLAQHLHDLLGDGYDRPGRGFLPVNAGEVLEAIERRSQGEVDGIRIGVAACDGVTAGFQRGELVVLGAVPKTGKSTFAAQLALYVALHGQGGAAFVAAEMPRRAVTERMLSALAGVPAHAMQRGLLAPNEWRRLVTAEARMRHAPLWIDDQAFPELRDVEQRVLGLKAQHPELALVVVDYLQLVQHRLKGRRGDEEIEAVANGLKKLADRADVVVVAPAQLNDKAVEARPDKRPTRQDISGSSGPVKAADFLALLHRPKLHTSSEPVEGDPLVVYVDAARRTGPFMFTLDWQASVVRAVERGTWTPPDAPLWPEFAPA